MKKIAGLLIAVGVAPHRRPALRGEAVSAKFVWLYKPTGMSLVRYPRNCVDAKGGMSISASFSETLFVEADYASGFEIHAPASLRSLALKFDRGTIWQRLADFRPLGCQVAVRNDRLDCATESTLDRGEQHVIRDRFCEERDCARKLASLACGGVSVCRYENSRNLNTPMKQMLLNLQTGHAWHLQIENKAIRQLLV